MMSLKFILALIALKDILKLSPPQLFTKRKTHLWARVKISNGVTHSISDGGTVCCGPKYTRFEEGITIVITETHGSTSKSGKTWVTIKTEIYRDIPYCTRSISSTSFRFKRHAKNHLHVFAFRASSKDIQDQH